METVKKQLPVKLEGHETDRLIFRKLRLDDLNDMLPFFESEKAMEFFKSPLLPKNHALEWLQRQLNRYNTFGDGLYGLFLKETHALAGMCGFIWQEVDGKEELEIGYHLLPDYWKFGYATEAATYCRNLARRNKLAPTIISIIDIHNINSQHVAMRNGMHRERQTIFKGIPVYIYRISLQ